MRNLSSGIVILRRRRGSNMRFILLNRQFSRYTWHVSSRLIRVSGMIYVHCTRDPNVYHIRDILLQKLGNVRASDAFFNRREMRAWARFFFLESISLSQRRRVVCARALS